jgi:ATP-dependent Clp protease ATP-binding subunit ClpC
MFERFTDSARRAVVLSRGEAYALKQDEIGTLHMLLGVLTAEEGAAGPVIAPLGVDPEGVRRQVISRYRQLEESREGHIPFSPAAKKAFEHALRESLALEHTYISTEHMALGLVDESSGDVGETLNELGVRAGAVRDAVMARLSAAGGAEPAEP